MLRSLTTLQGYVIEARDGHVGRIRDFLFEDDTWEIRYLVDDTGHWLPGRKVLIPTSIIEDLDWRDEAIKVPMTKEEIENGPGIETDAPVTRQMEMALFEHYRWIPYWAPYGMAQPMIVPIMPGAAISPAPEFESDTHPPVREERSADPHLQSFNDVMSFHVMHEGEDLGRMSDMIFDDATWEVASFVFDTGQMLMRGKRIQVEAERVRGILPDQGKITVDMTKEETETCPSFNLTQLIQEQLKPEHAPGVHAGNVR
ncbi:MAG: hypothetical protein HYV26_15215 [Candidatus Hydrogenedentes bacterium]|nr:hypothetical protein [Candidatus Hydrogenedentota bacterium]